MTLVSQHDRSSCFAASIMLAYTAHFLGALEHSGGYALLGSVEDLHRWVP